MYSIGHIIQVDIIARYIFIFIIFFCMLATVISLISLKKRSGIWWKLAIVSIELLLAASSLFLFVFIRWWLAIAPLLPFMIILFFCYLASRKNEKQKSSDICSRTHRGL